MSTPEKKPEDRPAASKPADETPSSVLLIPYPKIVFLYPTLLVAVVAAVVLSFMENPLDPSNRVASALSTLFLGVLGMNLVILSFDFPRTTSLTLFFLAVALVLGAVLLFTFYPDLVPMIGGLLARFRPLANPTFYWSVVVILAALYACVYFVIRFDYWEVRPNELLHHHGVLSNLERFSAPNLKIQKEINDVFEYLLLRSGRLILHSTDERRAIVLDNVPFIDRKEEQITRMLGALQVQIRPENERV